MLPMTAIGEQIRENEAVLTSLHDEFNEELTKLESRFTQKHLESAVSLAFDFLLRRTHEMKEDAANALTREASRGLPFKDRNPMLHKKIAWCESEIERLTETRKKYIVKEFRYWLEYGDYAHIKQVGLRHFVEMNLDRIIHSVSSAG